MLLLVVCLFGVRFCCWLSCLWLFVVCRVLRVVVVVGVSLRVARWSLAVRSLLFVCCLLCGVCLFLVCCDLLMRVVV